MIKHAPPPAAAAPPPGIKRQKRLATACSLAPACSTRSAPACSTSDMFRPWLEVIHNLESPSVTTPARFQSNLVPTACSALSTRACAPRCRALPCAEPEPGRVKPGRVARERSEAFWHAGVGGGRGGATARVMRRMRDRMRRRMAHGSWAACGTRRRRTEVQGPAGASEGRDEVAPDRGLPRPRPVSESHRGPRAVSESHRGPRAVCSARGVACRGLPW
jgi:hypothetical protein